MDGAVSRAELLRGRVRSAPQAPRPPYSPPEIEFRRLCEPCDACRKACPTQVIGTGVDRFPILRFGAATCTFCGACAEACPTGALDLDQAGEWDVTARIKGSCLSLGGITCRACEEGCEAGAIRFRLMPQGRSLPLVDQQRCTGCGACAVICPNDSIAMRRSGPSEMNA